MIGMKDFCVALLGIGLGVGGTQVAERSKPQKRQQASAPAQAQPGGVLPSVTRHARPGGGDLVIFWAPGAAPFCPPSVATIPQVSAPGGWGSAPSAPGAGVWAGGGGVTRPSPGGVPEIDTWAMLVAGFGLVGLSMRRRTRANSGCA